MRKLICLILCTILLLPLFCACGTTGGEDPLPVETEINPDENDWFDGSDPLPSDLTIPDAVRLSDGTVLGTIVVSASADETERFAAEELRIHIQKVTGADLPVVNRTGKGYGSLILGTPDSLPFLSELFPDDLAWLSTVYEEETGKHWGSDGFAVRRSGDHLFLFGAESRGTLNAVYDLLEDGFGILWIRENEDLGTVYEPQQEVTLAKTDYREKSPFQIRGWHLLDLWPETLSPYKMLSRNRLNLISPGSKNRQLGEIGVSYRIGINGNLKWHVLNSPLYDPEETEYWCTNAQGEALSPEESPQVNFWSEKTADVIAAAAVSVIQQNGFTLYFIGAEDTDRGFALPYSRQPYEYAPGLTVDPIDKNYISTVYHSFFNQIARKVAESCPDCLIGTYAYTFTQRPPACDIEPNRLIVYATTDESMTEPFCMPPSTEKHQGMNNADNYAWVTEWNEKTDHLLMYNYYGCSEAGCVYERSILERMQDDLQHYAEDGIWGLTPEGVLDMDGFWAWYTGPEEDSLRHNWDMNLLTYWAYSKLAWDPYLDLNELVEDFCRKVYGDAAPYMLEYHRLLKEGWDKGNENGPVKMNVNYKAEAFYQTFVIGPGIGQQLIDSLNQAYEAANDIQKQRISYVRDTVTEWVNRYSS